MDLREEFYEPVKIGPTWQTNPDGTWHLPEHTLGWEIAEWCAKWFRNPDGDPWKFTLEQFRWLLWWYAVDDNGEFVYRKGILQRCKGWGLPARTPLQPCSAWWSCVAPAASRDGRTASRSAGV